MGDVPKKGESGNEAVDANVVEVLAENESLKAQNVSQKAQIDSLTKNLKTANDLIDAQTKAGLIEDIRSKSDYGLEELSQMGSDELRKVRDHIKRIKGPIMSSADMGAKPASAGLDDLYGQGWRKK